MCTHTNTGTYYFVEQENCTREKRSTQTIVRSHWWGIGRGTHSAPACKPDSQLVQGETLSPLHLYSALPWSSELGVVSDGMLKQVMFTCTSKAIRNKAPGLRWVCGPSHLGLKLLKALGFILPQLYPSWVLSDISHSFAYGSNTRLHIRGG